MVVAESTSRSPLPAIGNRALARSGIISLAGAAIAAAMGLILVVVLGRFGSEGSGVVLQAIAAFSIAVALARLGTDSAAVWIMPRLRSDAAGLVRPIARRLTLTATIGGIITAGVMYGIAAILSATDVWSDEVASAVYVSAWALPFAATMTTSLAVSRGLSGVAAYVLIGNVLLPTLRPALVLVVAIAGLGILAASAVWAAPAALACVLALLISRRLLRRIEPASSLDNGAISLQWSAARSYAVPRLLSATLEQAIQWVGVIIIGTLASSAAAGIYGSASRVIAALLIVDAAMRVVVSPEFSRLLHMGDLASLARVYRTATSWLVLFSTPIALLLMVFSDVVLLIIGTEFVDGAVVIAILGSGSIVTLMAGNVHSVLLMSGRSGLAAINKAVALTVNVTLMFVLVPWLGIAGAAAAWTTGMLLDALLATIQVNRLVGFRVPLAAGLYPLVIALVAVGAPALAARLWLGPTWFSFFVAAAVGATTFMAWCALDRKRLFGGGLRTPRAARIGAENRA